MTGIFIQSPPVLGNQYRDDAFLRGYLRRKLPPAVLQEIESELELLGSLAGGELYRLQLADRLHEPRLTQWDPWGRRIDAIELSPLWQHAAPLAAKAGLVALPYEARHGRFSRIHQFAAVYLFHPSTDVYTCPLAMTDGAARTLLNAGNPELIERAVPHLTSRDPHFAWTSGQWMTETTGGSDVGASLTTARQDEHGTWRLFGKKWFTSAVTSQMALTLARPAGNGPGGSGLAMFYVETRDRDGHLHNIRVERLKDKLGTRKVPTAELLLEGTPAILVGETRNGTRAIEPMLTITRAWNSVTSVAFMRRALALASSYARERRAFGKSLAELPLHIDTLALLETETRAAFLLAFEIVELLGTQESGEIDQSQHALLRLLTPIAKLLTAKQTVACVSEAIEAFGGAGYIEDTGIPLLLRDAQVLPIWEGTTNVLSLDALLRSDPTAGMKALLERTLNCRAAVREPHLIECAERSLAVIQKARAWLENRSDPQTTQASARRFAMTIGRGFELALLTEHAQWQLDELQDRSGMAAAMRFASLEIDELYDVDLTDSRSLLPPRT
jgi:alkylation response protein AidB-like acyl-CoA dehydrogenase